MNRRRLFVALVGFVLAAPFIARAGSAVAASGRIYSDVKSAPGAPIAVVFGAAVRNGYPSAILYDRVATAVDLYKAGKVRKLLMSGDNRFENYNEPAAMRRTALDLGVPDADIVLDHAGRSTYETCYRARDIFGLTNVVLVTQDFHLDRALLLCRGMGITAIGVAADRRPYLSIRWSQFREIPATLNAMIELWITQPKPVLGDKIKIDGL
jgi:SanA protein